MKTNLDYVAVGDGQTFRLRSEMHSLEMIQKINEDAVRRTDLPKWRKESDSRRKLGDPFRTVEVQAEWVNLHTEVIAFPK